MDELISKFQNLSKLDETTLIDIKKYTKKFEEYPQDLVIFAEENKLQLPSLTSMKGQALALMSQEEVRGQKHIGREEAVTFFNSINMETTDAIQQFNKATGLKRIKMRGNYCLEYPFQCDTTDLDKRKGVWIVGDRNSIINNIKQFYKKNVVEVPNDEWQIGHLDPTINDASEKNLAYQPPIQGRYRDRFKWCPLFMKMWPVAETELIPKFNDYYTDKEQKRIYEELKKKFG